MKGPARGIPAMLMGGFFVFVSVMMARDRLEEFRLGRGSEDWPVVQGEVLRSAVQRRSGSRRARNRSSLVFSYRYEVGGTEYEGDRVAFTAIKLGRIPDAYQVGDTVPVFYDPADPGQSAVEPGVPSRAVAMSLAPFLIFAAIGLTLAGWGIHIVRRN